jgi:hypothetical protein
MSGKALILSETENWELGTENRFRIRHFALGGKLEFTPEDTEGTN